MDDIINSISSIIPPKYQFLIGLSLILGRVIQAIRTGGGLKSILASIWLGTNHPKPPVANATNGTTAAGDKSTIVPLLLLGALLAGCAPCLTGCKATPAKAAVNASDTSRITVEHALGAWNDYIIQFHPPVSQQAQVRAAWEKYKAAQLVVLDAALIYKETNDAAAGQKLNAAIANAGNTLNDLLKLINNLTK